MKKNLLPIILGVLLVVAVTMCFALAKNGGILIANQTPNPTTAPTSQSENKANDSVNNPVSSFVGSETYAFSYKNGEEWIYLPTENNELRSIGGAKLRFYDEGYFELDGYESTSNGFLSFDNNQFTLVFEEESGEGIKNSSDKRWNFTYEKGSDSITLENGWIFKRK